MPAPFRITGTARFHKSRKKPQMPLLPGDAGILKEIEKKRAEAQESRSVDGPLEYIGPLRDFTPFDAPAKQGAPKKAQEMDIGLVVRSLLLHMWSEFPTNDKGSFTISPKTVAETAEFRASVPAAVTLSQIYGVFPSRTTQVDRAIGEACRAGTTRIVPINAHDGSLDLIIESNEFYSLVDPTNPEFGEFCRARPDRTWFDAVDLRNAGVDIQATVSQGFLVVDPGRPGVHSLAIPNQGRLLKLVRQCRAWLLKTMTQANRKFKELPESQIQDKLETTKRYWTQFRGVRLEWILYDAIGSGYVDGFSTPVGRGWKVLRT